MGEWHTPGPWGVVVAGFDGWWVEGPSFVYPLADVVIIENEADARLIAAAPDLLAALEALAEEALSMDGQIHDEWGQGPWPRGTDVPEIEAARAAIVKATGKET